MRSAKTYLVRRKGLALLFLAIVAIIVLQTFANASVNVTTVSMSPSVVPEGRDFATWVLAAPWDMEQYSDVSKYINESGVATHLQNIQTTDGIFSAQSADTDAQFYVLFPGYQSAINAGKVGSRYPIDTSAYQCLYLRMKTDSDTSYDEMRIWWVEDNTLSLGTDGVTLGIDVARSEWKVHSVDLDLMTDPVWSDASWSERAEWQGIRIDPTIKTGVNFYVDWVRLTDCNPVTTTVSWTPVSGNVEIWAGIGQATPDFKVAEYVPGGDGLYELDVQGWEPGSYYIGVKDISGFDWSESPLQIDPAPRVTFTKPSFDSGESLAWEMNGENELDQTHCVQYAFNDGILDLVTLSPNDLSPECGSGGISDPKLDLTVPITQVDTTIYQYLSIRIYTEGPWEDVNNGWMMRWIWRTYEGGDPSQWCLNVSNDIPFDTGWDTLTVDLHDAFEGLTEDYGGGYHCHHRNWSDDPTDYLRLDPNENTTASFMHQQLDWIRLSRMDRVAQGSLFSIKMNLSEPTLEASFSFYYTSDKSNPHQHVATIATGTPGTPITLPNRIYLPMVQRNWSFDAITFLWDTTGVPAGEYYICVEVNDGLNDILRCSEAPVKVY